MRVEINKQTWINLGGIEYLLVLLNHLVHFLLFGYLRFGYLDIWIFDSRLKYLSGFKPKMNKIRGFQNQDYMTPLPFEQPQVSLALPT